MMSNKDARATLYVVGNINVDVIMGTLDTWPQRGTKVMLQHSELRPGGSAGNCSLALEAMQVRLRNLAHRWRHALRSRAIVPQQSRSHCAAQRAGRAEPAPGASQQRRYRAVVRHVSLPTTV
ncbi:hypothetical protein E05_04390 [Plautia stali symbiont]|nr:hypothetical protein E05_04390 [Plautia stali symbiont]